MKRSFGVGDILVGVGVLMMLAFLIVCLITGGTSANFIEKNYKDNPWPLINGILLGVLILGAAGLFVYSLFNPKMLVGLYMFAAFVIVLHIVDFGLLAPYSFRYPGMPFYIFTGALLIGLGAYMAQQGIGAFIGGEKTTKKKSKE